MDLDLTAVPTATHRVTLNMSLDLSVLLFAHPSTGTIAVSSRGGCVGRELVWGGLQRPQNRVPHLVSGLAVPVGFSSLCVQSVSVTLTRNSNEFISSRCVTDDPNM